MLTQARGATICDPPRPPISRQLPGFNAPQGSADGSKIRPKRAAPCELVGVMMVHTPHPCLTHLSLAVASIRERVWSSIHDEVHSDHIPKPLSFSPSPNPIPGLDGQLTPKRNFFCASDRNMQSPANTMHIASPMR